MRSVRFLLFGVFPLVAISCFIWSEIRQSIVLTGDWRDLTIVGRGYFCTLDEDGDRESYRSIRLGLNRDGTLCANVNGVLRPLEPHFSMPMICDRIEIRRDGIVLCTADGEDLPNTLGTISIEQFATGENNNSNWFADLDAARVVLEPGQSGAGYLMQHAAFQYCLPLTNKVVVGCGFAIVWVAMVVWSIWKESY
ncbi:MAG: hypothetical protein JNK57_05500 [Planctomycetaceae bacterium]|nr:hypothetical protein [Planctomycetaceae bacterium]